MAGDVPTRKRGVPALHWVPRPRTPVPGKGVPTRAGYENQHWLSSVRQRDNAHPDILVKGWSTDSLTHKHTP